MKEAIKVCDCGHPPTERKPGDCATGYAYDAQNRTVCFACCAENDKRSMIETGNSKALPLYLSKDSEHHYTISNWPGTLKFEPYHVMLRRHPFTRAGQTVVHFTGPDGKQWTGRQIGEFTQILHARRLKG